MSTTANRPLRLTTVNKNPDRASRIIARFIADIRPTHTIQHVANCSKISDLRGLLEAEQPDLLFCASTWTETEAAQIIRVAREVGTGTEKLKGIKTYVVPRGLVDRDGEDAMVRHLRDNVADIINGT